MPSFPLYYSFKLEANILCAYTIKEKIYFGTKLGKIYRFCTKEKSFPMMIENDNN